MGRTEVQASYDRDGILAQVSTGLAYGYWDHAHALDDDTALGDLLTGPEVPYLSITQADLRWTHSVTIGIPIGTGNTGVGGYFTIQRTTPIAQGKAQFQCVGCNSSATYSDFEPGDELSAVIGWRGLH